MKIVAESFKENKWERLNLGLGMNMSNVF
jgi:hypothetical protein